MKRLFLLIAVCAGIAAAQCPTGTNYPGALDTAQSLTVAANNVATTLENNMQSGDTAAVLTNASGWVPYMMATIDSGANMEIVFVTAVSGNVLTVARGCENTAAVPHASGVGIANNATAYAGHTSVVSAIEAMQALVGAAPAHGVAIGEGAGTFHYASGSAGQVLAWNSSGDPSFQNAAANPALSNLSVPTAVSTNLLPGSASAYTMGSSAMPWSQVFAAPNNPFSAITDTPALQGTVGNCVPGTLDRILNGNTGIVTYGAATCAAVPTGSSAVEGGALAGYVLNGSTSGTGVPLSAMAGPSADGVAIEANILISDYQLQFCPGTTTGVTLASDISSNSTTIPLSCAAAAQVAQSGHITIGGENIEICGGSGSTLTTCSISGTYALLNDTVTAASASGTTVTLTLTSTTGFYVGQIALVSGITNSGTCGSMMPCTYDGAYPITGITGNTLQYTVTNAGLGTATLSSATAVPFYCQAAYNCYDITSVTGNTFPKYLSPYATSNTTLSLNGTSCTVNTYVTDVLLYVTCGSAPSSSSSWTYNGRGSQGTLAASHNGPVGMTYQGDGVVQTYERVTGYGIEFDMNNFSASSGRIGVEIAGGGGVPCLTCSGGYSPEVTPAFGAALNIESIGPDYQTPWPVGLSLFPGSSVIGLSLGPADELADVPSQPIQFGAFGDKQLYITAEMYLDHTGNMVIQSAGTGAVIFQAGGSNQAMAINGGFTDLGNLYLPAVAPATGSPVGVCLGSVAANGGAFTTTGCPSGSSGANTALSNLAAVAINQSLVPGSSGLNIGQSSGNTWLNVYTGAVVSQTSLDLLASGSSTSVGIGNTTIGNVLSVSPLSPIQTSQTALRGTFELPDIAPATGTPVTICLASVASSNGALTTSGCPSSSGANTALSNLSSVAINASLLPGLTNSISLGSPSLLWQNGYFENIYALALAPMSGLNPLCVNSSGQLVTSGCSGGSGANTTLSNLSSPTAVSQNLIPGSSGLTLGTDTGGFAWSSLFVEFIENPAGPVLLRPGGSSSQSVTIEEYGGAGNVAIFQGTGSIYFPPLQPSTSSLVCISSVDGHIYAQGTANGTYCPY
jgi:hypothetical protein